MGEQFGKSMLPEKEEQQQGDTKRADDFRIDAQRKKELKDRDVDQVENRANKHKHRAPDYEGHPCSTS